MLPNVLQHEWMTRTACLILQQAHYATSRLLTTCGMRSIPYVTHDHYASNAGGIKVAQDVLLPTTERAWSTSRY